MSDCRKRKAAAHDQHDSTIPPKKLCFSDSYHSQNWSLPDSIIYNITMNPSTPKCYQKMIQSCKYFFIKNPIIVAEDIIYDIVRKEKRRKHCCYSDSDDSDEEDDDKPPVWQIKQNVEKKYIDIDKITSKLWITKKLTINAASEMPEKTNPLSFMFPKIFRCDIKCLKLIQQNISLNEYFFLTSIVDQIDFEKVIVRNDAGEIVALEKLVEIPANLEQFVFDIDPSGAGISSQTVTNLLKIPHFSKMMEFHLKNIPESFDIDAYFLHIKQNTETYTNRNLVFANSISQAYKNRLDAIIDEIFATKDCEYSVPHIEFIGIDSFKLQALEWYCIRYDEL